MIEALSVGVAFYCFVLFLRSLVICWEIHRHWTRPRYPDRWWIECGWKRPPDIDGMIAPVYRRWYPYD